MKLLNTTQAAEALGVSARRIRAMIDEGTLPAHRIGREYAIEESALSKVTTYGKPGRPTKKAGRHRTKKN
jgi:excisionase family DNA binding protein